LTVGKPHLERVALVGLRPAGIDAIRNEAGNGQCPGGPCCAPWPDQGQPAEARTAEVSTKSLRKGTAFARFSGPAARPGLGTSLRRARCPVGRSGFLPGIAILRNFCRTCCSHRLDIRLLSLSTPVRRGFFVRLARAHSGRRKSSCKLATANEVKRNCGRVTDRGEEAWSVNREPMNKNRIEGAAEQGERARSREALVAKARRRKSGGCAVKECVLPRGDLA
jgi:hypothetical protein